MSGQRHALAVLYPRERIGTHSTGGWVGPRAGLDGPTAILSPDRPARSQSLRYAITRRNINDTTHCPYQNINEVLCHTIVTASVV